MSYPKTIKELEEEDKRKKNEGNTKNKQNKQKSRANKDIPKSNKDKNKQKNNNKMTNKINVQESDFQDKVIEKSREIPIVVDYWAPWCGPCVMIGPVLEKLSEEYDGKFILAKVNVDENPVISQLYNIMSIPSVKMFKDGKIVDEFIGVIPEPAIKEWIDKNIE